MEGRIWGGRFRESYGWTLDLHSSVEHSGLYYFKFNPKPYLDLVAECIKPKKCTLLFLE